LKANWRSVISSYSVSILSFETEAGITAEMVNAATLLTLSNWEPDRPVTTTHYFNDRRFAV